MSIKYNGKTVAGNYKISASTTASDTKAGPIKIATEQELKDTTNNKVAVTPYLLNKALNGVNRGLKIGRIGIGFINESQQQERYLNGQVIIQDQFESFATWVKDLIKLYPNLSCTNEEFENACTLSAFGQCGKFVVDDNAGSIRLPKVVNVQGLFDLTQAGLTVEAGLPNIYSNNMAQGSRAYPPDGAVYAGDEVSNIQSGTAIVFQTRHLDASRSNPIYGNSTTVQQEAVQYPYWIQVATGVETSVDVTRELELNNPFFFGMSQYFDVEPNNISWLKSAGQWNSKALYPSYYNWILSNVNNGVEGFIGNTMYMWGSASGGYMCQTLTPKVGSPIWGYASKTKVGYVTKVYDTGELDIIDNKNNVSYTKVDRYSQGDESSNVYITGYDFVLNTTDETFRLPLKTKLASGKAVAGNGMTLGLTDGTNNAGLRICSRDNFELLNTTTYSYDKTIGVADTNNAGLANEKTVGITTDPTKSGIETSDSGLYLYFYVGETVQNANLVNLGRVEETLASLIPDNSSLISGYGMPSDKYVELSLGTSGTPYTAPANGWFYIDKYAGVTNAYIDFEIYSKDGNFKYEKTSTVPLTNYVNRLLVSVVKGDVLTCKYSATGTTNYFRFIYAKGSESEAQ